jgi:hypothetical protein
LLAQRDDRRAPSWCAVDTITAVAEVVAEPVELRQHRVARIAPQVVALREQRNGMRGLWECAASERDDRCEQDGAPI